MNIQLIEQEGHRGIEVVVTSAPGDARAAKLVDRLQSFDDKLVAYEPGTITRRVVPLDDVLLVEVHEGRVWVSTDMGVELESPLRLYELEEALEGTEFVRASKQVIVNLEKVVSLCPEMNRCIMLTLEDGTAVLTTRAYAQEIKRRLGIAR